MWRCPSLYFVCRFDSFAMEVLVEHPLELSERCALGLFLVLPMIYQYTTSMMIQAWMVAILEDQVDRFSQVWSPWIQHQQVSDPVTYLAYH